VISLTDPTLLSQADTYRQAKTIYSRNDRSSGDPNWFQSPEKLECQWHIWFDGGRDIHSATFSFKDGQWRNGPALTLAALTTAENVEQLFAALITTSSFGFKPKALGIILHVGDELGLAKLDEASSALCSGEDVQLVRYNLIEQPVEALDDKKISEELASWRLLPFPGSKAGHTRCTAISLTRTRETFLKKLITAGEAARIPVRVAVTSAPLEALAAIPLLTPQIADGCLLVLPYLKFTAVFLISEQGELVSMRSLVHRTDSPLPIGLRDILWNMAVRAEMGGLNNVPKVLVVSQNEAIKQLILRELGQTSNRDHELDVSALDLSEQPATSKVPGRHLEFLLYESNLTDRLKATCAALAKTETFSNLWNWAAKQSFFNTAKLDAQYPSLSDFRLMRLSKWAFRMMGLTLLMVLGYGAHTLFQAMNHPSWKLTTEEIDKAKETHARLLLETQQIAQTKFLMLPRSRGWVNLEFLYHLFPEDSGVRLEKYSYLLESDKTVKPAVKGDSAANIALLRTWSFKGLVKSKGMEVLSNLNSQRGLTAFFEKVAKMTGDKSYEPDSTRLLTVTLTQSRNPRYDSQATASDAVRDPVLSFPFAFEATITQKISDKDTFALPIEKPF
jgi:hypothetical protein